jgi:hypothetical protein
MGGAMSNKKWVPVYAVNDHEFFFLYQELAFGTEEEIDTTVATLFGTMLDDDIKFVETREFDLDNVPHVKARIGEDENYEIAIVGGPILDMAEAR